LTTKPALVIQLGIVCVNVSGCTQLANGENIKPRGRSQGSGWNRYDRNRLSVAGKEFHFITFMIILSANKVTLSVLGSNIGYGLFVGWVEYPDIFCWVSPADQPNLATIFVLSAKPNKMACFRLSRRKGDKNENSRRSKCI
jgi:hypothetical protein